MIFTNTVVSVKVILPKKIDFKCKQSKVNHITQKLGSAMHNIISASVCTHPSTKSSSSTREKCSVFTIKDYTMEHILGKRIRVVQTVVNLWLPSVEEQAFITLIKTVKDFINFACRLLGCCLTRTQTRYF